MGCLRLMTVRAKLSRVSRGCCLRSMTVLLILGVKGLSLKTTLVVPVSA